MSVAEIKNMQEFMEHINSGKVVFVDFWATWCGPCRFISPKFEDLARNNTSDSVVFCKVDVDNVPDVSQEAGIRAMPTFQVYKNGDKVGELVGADIGRLTALVNQNASM